MDRQQLLDTPRATQTRGRVWIARAFTGVEDVVYIGLGLLLAGGALTLLGTGIINFGKGVVTGDIRPIQLLDRILLILLIVEMLYTVQVSFRGHALTPEPFLLVGLISAVRRVLVLTAEFGETPEKTALAVQYFCMEIVVLTALILALAVSLALLRRRSASADSQPA
jgi:uncharacterized membrane protein (DUF373 family)